MRRLAFTAATLALLAASVAQAAERDDSAGRKAMAEDFKPFDAMESQGWEAVAPSPFFRTIKADGSDAVQFDLKPGSYMIVAKCHCGDMEVTLVAPGGAQPMPLRSSAQAALFSIDATATGSYLAGIDMGDCDAKSCDVAVKVYRKK